jgi:hypothetical protein
MPDGTALDPLVAGFNWSGTSNLASVYAQVGGQAATLTAIHSAFDAWSAVADIQFVQFDENGIPPATEREPFDLHPPPTFFDLNDLVGLVAHELGHALGLGRSDVPSSLMCGYVSPSFDGSECHWADPDANGQAPITPKPKPDDIAPTTLSLRNETERRREKGLLNDLSTSPHCRLGAQLARTELRAPAAPSFRPRGPRARAPPPGCFAARCARSRESVLSASQ